MADKVQYGGLENVPIKYVDISSGGTEAYAQATAIVLDTSGGGGGTPWTGEVTIADGADEALGSRADAAATTDTGTFSLIALFKRLLQKMTDFLSRIPAALTASGNFKVSIEESIVTTVDIETVLPSLSVSANRTSADIVNSHYRRMIVYFDITANPGDSNFSISPQLQVKDPVSGDYQTIWTSDTVINSGGNGLRSYYFGDSASGGEFNETVAFGIPGGTFRIVGRWNGGAATTYSVAIAMMQ